MELLFLIVSCFSAVSFGAKLINIDTGDGETVCLVADNNHSLITLDPPSDGKATTLQLIQRAYSRVDGISSVKPFNWKLINAKDTLQGPVEDKRWESFPTYHDHFMEFNNIESVVSFSVCSNVTLTLLFYNKLDKEFLNLDVVFGQHLLEDQNNCQWTNYAVQVHEYRNIIIFYENYKTKLSVNRAEYHPSTIRIGNYTAKSFWKIHEYKFHHSQTPDSWREKTVLKFKPNFNSPCISLLAAVTKTNYLKMTLQYQNKKIEKTVSYLTQARSDLIKWQTVEFQLDQFEETGIVDDLKLTLFKGTNSKIRLESGYWAFRDVSFCSNNRYDIYNISGQRNSQYRCTFVNQKNEFQDYSLAKYEAELNKVATSVVSALGAQTYLSWKKHGLVFNRKISGCTWGYKGSNCNIECPQGFWGINCKSECPKDCGRGQCDPIKGCKICRKEEYFKGDCEYGTVTVQSVTHNSLGLKWDPPAQEIVQSYSLTYGLENQLLCKTTRRQPFVQVLTTNNSQYLSGLKSFANYSITIQANTVHGPFQLQKFITTDQSQIMGEELPARVYFNDGSAVTMILNSCEYFGGNLNYTLILKCVSEWCVGKEENVTIILNRNTFNTTIANIQFDLMDFTEYEPQIEARRHNHYSMRKTYPPFTSPCGTPEKVTGLKAVYKNTTTVNLQWKPAYPPTGKFLRYIVWVSEKRFVVDRNSSCTQSQEYICVDINVPNNNNVYNIIVQNINENCTKKNFNNALVILEPQNQTYTQQSGNVLISPNIKGNPVLSWQSVNDTQLNAEYDVEIISDNQFHHYKQQDDTLELELLQYFHEYKIYVKSELVEDEIFNYPPVNVTLFPPLNSYTSCVMEICQNETDSCELSLAFIHNNESKVERFNLGRSQPSCRNKTATGTWAKSSKTLQGNSYFRKSTGNKKVLAFSFDDLDYCLIYSRDGSESKLSHVSNEDFVKSYVFLAGAVFLIIIIAFVVCCSSVYVIRKYCKRRNCKREKSEIVENNDYLKPNYRFSRPINVKDLEIYFIDALKQRNNAIQFQYDQVSEFCKDPIDSQSMVPLPSTIIQELSMPNCLNSIKFVLSNNVHDVEPDKRLKQILANKISLAILDTETIYFQQSKISVNQQDFSISIQEIMKHPCFIEEQLTFTSHANRTIFKCNFLRIPMQCKVNALIEILQKIMRYECKRILINQSRVSDESTIGLLILCLTVLSDKKKPNQVDFFTALYDIKLANNKLLSTVDDYIFAHYLVIVFLRSRQFSIKLDTQFNENLKNALNATSVKPLLVKLQHFKEMVNLMTTPKTCLLSENESAFKWVDCTFHNQVVTNYRTPFKTLVSFVAKNRIHTVIFLNQITDTQYPIWPFQIGNFSSTKTMRLVEKRKNDYYELMRIDLLDERSNYRYEVVFIFMKSWISYRKTPSRGAQHLLLMQMEMLNFSNNNSSPKVLLACQDGSTATGLYIASDFLIRKYHYDEVYDIYSAITNAAGVGSILLEDWEQVEIIYKIVNEHGAFLEKAYEYVPCTNNDGFKEKP